MKTFSKKDLKNNVERQIKLIHDLIAEKTKIEQRLQGTDRESESWAYHGFKHNLRTLLRVALDIEECVTPKDIKRTVRVSKQITPKILMTRILNKIPLKSDRLAFMSKYLNSVRSDDPEVVIAQLETLAEQYNVIVE